MVSGFVYGLLCLRALSGKRAVIKNGQNGLAEYQRCTRVRVILAIILTLSRVTNRRTKLLVLLHVIPECTNVYERQCDE